MSFKADLDESNIAAYSRKWNRTVAARCQPRVRRRERPYREPFLPPPSTPSIIAPPHGRPVARTS